MGFRRMIALLLSALLLLTPVLSAAEEYVFPAGELTTTTLSDSYFGGYQINAQFGFDVDTDAVSAGSERMKAAAVLLEKAQVKLSFYDDFGTARIRGSVNLDGAEVLSGDMLIFEDGSVQLVTSLTGNMAFTLPAGTVTENGINLPREKLEWTEETFGDLPAFDRLSITGQNMISTLINLLLGWVSGTQMTTGDLYAFDYETYIEATETRDAVATRMIGTIRGMDLMRFMWNVVGHIRDKEHEFQAALADSIAKLGVTRYQGRQVIDALLPDEEIDPEADLVQASSDIPDDGALFTYNDVHYFLRKLEKSLMNAWGENASMEKSSMIVSYDDFGEMVGFDVDLVRFTKNYPYEGDFTYSIRTDDNWQRMHTSHGELQVYGNQRIIGDLDMQFGEDVDGVKASHLVGQLDVVDQTDNTSVGFGVVSSVDFAVAPDNASETIEANADLLLNVTGESTALLDANFSAVSQLTDMGLTLTGVLSVEAAGLPHTAMNVSIDCVEYEDTPFEGGQAVDLSAQMTDAQLEEIKNTVKGEAAALGVKLALKPVVLGNLLKLVEGLGK